MSEFVKIDKLTTNGNVRVEAEPSPALLHSIAQHGIIQPIVVDDQYQVIAGHRRLAAAISLEFDVVPVHVSNRTVDEVERLGMQVAENLHRKDLTDYELAQAAWDLKLAGANQKQVKEQMSISKDAVAKYQHIGKALNADTDLDPVKANQLTMHALEVITDDTTAAPSDIIRLIVDDNMNAYTAVRQIEAELTTVAFYDEHAEQLAEWATDGVQVTSINPVYHWDKKNQYGGPMTDKKPRRLDMDNRYDDVLAIAVEDHIGLPCHMVWVATNVGYNNPTMQHWCMDHAKHLKKEAPVRPVNADDVVAAKEKSSSEARKMREAKKLRREQSAQWMATRTSVKDMREWALELATKLFLEDQVRTAMKLEGLDSERPKGADYGWYNKRFKQFVADEDFSEEQLAWYQLKVILAHQFIEQHWPIKAVKERIEIIEIDD